MCIRGGNTNPSGPRGHWIAAVLVGTAIWCQTPTWAATAQWHWDNPLPRGNALNAVWGAGPADVFAVGDYGTILHYDGTAWKKMTSGTTNRLWGVWGSSSQDVFAVGDLGTILQHRGR